MVHPPPLLAQLMSIMVVVVAVTRTTVALKFRFKKQVFLVFFFSILSFCLVFYINIRFVYNNKPHQKKTSKKFIFKLSI